MPEYRRHIVTERPIFATVVTRGRVPWLENPAHSRLLLSSMQRVKAIKPFRNHAYVILPDHFHWLITPGSGETISQIIGAVKRDVTWQLKGAQLGRPLWQPRFYDHVIRHDLDFSRHLDYIHYNPVRHGVAKRPSDHPFSSFGEWEKRGVYAADWGIGQEPAGLDGIDLE